MAVLSWNLVLRCSVEFRRRGAMDDRTVDLIFAGSLESLPPVSSKIVRIFTSSTFTGYFTFTDNCFRF